MNGSSLRVAFRTDASVQIGTGHVMRCLTLADALRMHGADCVFLCRPHDGNLLHQIAERGHRSLSLTPVPVESVARSPDDPSHADWLGTDWAQDADDTRQGLDGQAVDWLVVDHYAIDHRWESAMRGSCNRLLVMDDLADRKHDCDLLLDPSLGRTDADYADLVPAGTTTLLGPQHALLRPEFAQLRAESLARRVEPELRHLLITMGGVDKDNVTGSLLDTLDACALPPDTRITIVMGIYSPWLGEVRARAERMRAATEVLVGVKNMARLMTDSDLAIGAAGGTSWERCCLGLPTIQLILAKNQMECAAAFSQLGAVSGITSPARISIELPAALQHLNPDRLRDLSDRAAQICEGRGTSILAQLLLRSQQRCREAYG